MLSQRSHHGIMHRSSALSVQQCCFHTWCNKRASTPAPVATPTQALPPASPPQQPLPVAVQAAAEPEVVIEQQMVAAAAAANTPKPPSGRSFWDVMKFNGAAPELINGRLAMIGIIAAARNEVRTGDALLEQAQHAPAWVYVLLLVWVYASLVPMFKGARHEAFGIFTPRAEVTNGRAAMLGFAILAALEFKAGVPFF